jgi:hypothetical protein
MVPVGKPTVVPAAEESLAPVAHDRLGPTPAKPPARQKSGLHRYCSGCTRETKHVAWVRDGQASTPSIRWPAAEPASGTTVCLTCGQWRALASQAGPTAWSSWPRELISRRNLVIAAESASDADSETSAENEGMLPKREPRPARAA